MDNSRKKTAVVQQHPVASSSATKQHIGLWAVVVCMAMLTTSCLSFDKLMKSTDYEAKYKAAQQYYHDGSYSKASQLLENLQLHVRNQQQSEDIMWLYAQSLHKMKDYYSAAYQYSNFARRYPYSEHAEEAAFQAAYCKYRDIPVSSLDQTLTRETITEFERFVERFPRSTHVPEVNGYLDEMRDILVEKDYNIAVGYYTTEAYHAAQVDLRNFINKYPECKQREDAMYYLILADYRYAINSREDKVQERLQTTVDDFDKFAASFRESQHMSSAQNIYTQSRARMAEIESNTKQ